MIAKIGKYQILERIGRGGMGMVFKAHDPILDRLVALKIISNDIEVTEELRARFYREAQACARLNHPDIITIYDMGEDDGRLFIVMELLEGEELRQMIAERRSLALEDKIAIMMQVCDGLHYAHERGIVHRDIKPSNIVMLRTGLVKILDFGLAHVTTSEATLTRTGLIVGTLRYISPEQARGRVDHRSDVFSVGAVFHEFLTFRPLLAGSDPMQILEQLRSEELPRLTDVDPTLPPDLSAVVERAIKKDPVQRLASLGEMRVQLEQVQRRLADEAQRGRARVEAKLAQLRQLESALAERIGGKVEGGGPPSIDARPRISAILALEEEISAALERLEAKARRADALAPRFQRGLEMLGGGHFDEAIAEFEAVLAELPEHARAAEQLQEARQRAEAQRQRDFVRRRLQDARAALQRGSFAVSLQALQEVAEVAPAVGLVREAAELREATEEGRAAQEAARREEIRRQRERAEEAQVLMAAERALAGEVEAGRRAERLWSAAEAKAGEAHALFDREGYVEAAEVLQEATVLYRRAGEGAREAIRIEETQRQREAAEHARERMTRGRTAALAVEAAQRAAVVWGGGEGKFAEAQAAFANDAYTQAGERYEEATALYGRAEEAAREAIRRDEIARQREQAAFTIGAAVHVVCSG